MRGSGKRNTPSLPNAFSSSFLQRILERDEPPTGAEADVAGPWHIAEIPGRGFGLFRAGESATQGFQPAAAFPDRWLALIAAAVLPGTGRDPLLTLQADAGAEGFRVALADGTPVGSFQLFDENLRDGMNTAVSLLRSPEALAWLLEAAGPLTLERCCTILDERVGGNAGE